MDHKISVTVHVDLDGRNVRIVVTGCLTEFSQRALHLLIRRARTLTSNVQVTVDLSEVRHVEPLGLELLRQAVDQDEAVGTRSPLHLVVAEPSRPWAAPPQGAWTHRQAQLAHAHNERRGVPGRGAEGRRRSALCRVYPLRLRGLGRTSRDGVRVWRCDDQVNPDRPPDQCP